jgi:filamentous hemagglutinin family protein
MSIMGFWRYLLGIAFGSAWVWTTNCVNAQITADRTLPSNSSVTINGGTFNITGGTQAGRNLFHSFQQFSVPDGKTAYFNNGLDIQNIFSRVTGGSVSIIEGIIQANKPANVFLLNPSGIIFGKNASLNIGGSFVATTANAIQFSNQGTFSASAPNNPALLTVNPSALLYNQIAASIQNYSIASVNGNVVGLQVPDGKSLLLVGGNINLDGGHLTASSGRVELGAIAGAGKVDLNFVDNQLRLSVPDSIPRADISLTNKASVDVTGNGNGSIGVSAHNLEMKGGSQISAGVKTGTAADNSPPGDITLNTTGLLTIMNPSRVTNKVQVTIGGTEDTKKGDAGDINIIAGDIYIDNRNTSADYNPGDGVPAALEASSGGIGRAGNISLSAIGSINLIGQAFDQGAGMISTFFLTSLVPGGGDITLKANGSISLKDSYLISSSGYNAGNISLLGKKSVSITDNSYLDAGTVQGNSGNITIKSEGPISIDRSSLGDNVGKGSAGDGIPGNGGTVNISGRSISITGGSFIESSAEEEAINSGSINLSATDTIEISGYDPFFNPQCCTGSRNRSFLYTTLQTSSLPLSFGQAGNININTPILRVSDGAILRADSQNVLRGGNINVNAKVVELRNGGQLVTSASSTGNAGNIHLTNTERLVIDGTNPTFYKFIAQGFVPTGPQDMGMYILGTTSPRSGIFAETKSGLGGNITIDTPNLLLLRRNALIAATADTNGSGGNVTINAPNGFIVAVPSENSDILANANLGSGGQIRISAIGIYGLENRTNLPPDPNISEINASSKFGQDGTVQIKTPDVDPSRGLILDNIPHH